MKRLSTSRNLLAVGILSILTLTFSSCSHNRPLFQFAVYGDNRSNIEAATQVIQLIDQYDDQIDMIFNTGDFVARGDMLDRWERNLKAVEILESPLYVAIGNHELRGDPTAANFRRFLKPPGDNLYYAIEHKNALFLVLNSEDTTKAGAIVGKQLEWLKQQLETTTARYKFIILHRPFYPVYAHIGSSLDEHPREREVVHRLLEKHNVTLVFAGHNHYYATYTHNGIRHITTGGGGAPLYAKEEQGGFYHFILVKVFKDRVLAQAIDTNNQVRDEVVVPVR